MSYCKYCGTKLADDAAFCTGCGARICTEFTLTIKRENQFFLVNPPIKLNITGMGVNQQYAINNGEIVPIKLPEGQYTLNFSASIRSETCSVNLNKDTFFRLAWNRFSGHIEAWEISGI